MLHLIQHTLEDTWLILPMLYLSYLMIEYIERKKSTNALLTRLQTYGPLLGAFIGIIPQCGFSVIASMLFLSRSITLGTLISVFISTSDEAIPILISNPSLYNSMVWIIVIKIGLGILVGYIVDQVIYPRQKMLSFKKLEENHKQQDTCPCCYTQSSIALSALFRTLKIFTFIFSITFLLNLIIREVGEETLGKLLLNDSLLQPIVTATFGFIPNCIVSVVLTQLYVAQQISFASLVSGLITNAGLGIVMLIRYHTPLKDLLRVIFILLISAILCGMILQFIT